MKKSENMLIWLSKMVLVRTTLLHCLLRLVKAQQSLKPVVDWLDSLIGLGGGFSFLLVVSHLFAVPVLV
jgi:hypothetical protein